MSLAALGGTTNAITKDDFATAIGVIVSRIASCGLLTLDFLLLMPNRSLLTNIAP